jgi:glycerophosphodiester phosphodiesterase
LRLVSRSRSNVAEVVYVQHLMGVDGVIVDLVQEIAEAVSAFTVVTAVQASGSQDGGGIVVGERMETAAVAVAGTPSFSPREVSFLLRLIPELVQ